jgi:hypothetical protein
MSMQHFRISRYRFGLSDASISTWTSISDIGQSFDDGVLTLEEYERVEELYLRAVRILLETAGSPDLVINEIDFTPHPTTPSGKAIHVGARFNVEEALEVCRMELREELSCRLDADDGSFHVVVGFDYYLYVGTTQAPEAAIQSIEESGLFVERDVPSSYMFED